MWLGTGWWNTLLISRVSSFPSWSLLNEDTWLKFDMWGGSSHMTSLSHIDRDSYRRHILSCFSLWWITGCRKNDHQYVVIRHCSRDLFDYACVTISFFDGQYKDHREKKARYRFADSVYETSIYCKYLLDLIYLTSWAISIAAYFYKRFIRKLFGSCINDEFSSFFFYFDDLKKCVTEPRCCSRWKCSDFWWWHFYRLRQVIFPLITGNSTIGAFLAFVKAV